MITKLMRRRYPQRNCLSNIRECFAVAYAVCHAARKLWYFGDVQTVCIARQ
jgi:hypothetical protein